MAPPGAYKVSERVAAKLLAISLRDACPNHKEPSEQWEPEVKAMIECLTQKLKDIHASQRARESGSKAIDILDLIGSKAIDIVDLMGKYFDKAIRKAVDDIPVNVDELIRAVENEKRDHSHATRNRRLAAARNKPRPDLDSSNHHATKPQIPDDAKHTAPYFKHRMDGPDAAESFEDYVWTQRPFGMHLEFTRCAGSSTSVDNNNRVNTSEHEPNTSHYQDYAAAPIDPAEPRSSAQLVDTPTPADKADGNPVPASSKPKRHRTQAIVIAEDTRYLGLNVKSSKPPRRVTGQWIASLTLSGGGRYNIRGPDYYLQLEDQDGSIEITPEHDAVLSYKWAPNPSHLKSSEGTTSIPGEENKVQGQLPQDAETEDWVTVAAEAEAAATETTA